MGSERRQNLLEKYEAWGYSHLHAKRVISYAFLFIVSTIAAFIFAFGYTVFVNPSLSDDALKTVDGVFYSFASGGVSGVSQVISLLIQIFFYDARNHLSIIYSISYFMLNVPLFILAFRGIGKRFAVFTLINVIEVSLFTSIMGDILPFINDLTLFISENGSLLARALFGGVCTGLSAAICFRFDFSDGGVNVIAYYIALKKRENVGKYSVLLNSIIVILYTILSSINSYKNSTNPEIVPYIGCALFSFIYMFMTSLVIDQINVRNKKVEVKITTSNKDLYKIILLNIPHGATLIKGTGAYSGEEKMIITMVVSSYEVNKLVMLVHKNDPQAFLQATNLSQVYGRFFMKPLK